MLYFGGLCDCVLMSCLSTADYRLVNKIELSHDIRFPTMWYARPAKPQISLRIRAV